MGEGQSEDGTKGQGGQSQGDGGKGPGGGTPVLEWISAGIGAILTLAILGFLGWEAWQGTGGTPAAVEVSLREVVPVAEGYVAEFTAANLSSSTAAAVEVEGVLSRDGREIATSRTTLDYVPGDSEQRGGLFFGQDPREGELELRALGYVEP